MNERDCGGCCGGCEDDEAGDDPGCGSEKGCGGGCGGGKGCCGGGGCGCCCEGAADGRHGHGERERRASPPGTEFLDLEISQVLFAEASALAREATHTILKQEIEARLRERLGDRLATIARLAADELADDLEANLAIEAKIAERREGRASAVDRLRSALAGDPAAKADDPAAAAEKPAPPRPER